MVAPFLDRCGFLSVYPPWHGNGTKEEELGPVPARRIGGETEGPCRVPDLLVGPLQDWFWDAIRLEVISKIIYDEKAN